MFSGPPCRGIALLDRSCGRPDHAGGWQAKGCLSTGSQPARWQGLGARKPGCRVGKAGLLPAFSASFLFLVRGEGDLHYTAPDLFWLTAAIFERSPSRSGSAGSSG